MHFLAYIYLVSAVLDSRSRMVTTESTVLGQSVKAGDEAYESIGQLRSKNSHHNESFYPINDDVHRRQKIGHFFSYGNYTAEQTPQSQVVSIEDDPIALSLLKDFRTCGKCSSGSAEQDFIKVGEQVAEFQSPTLDSGYAMCRQTTTDIKTAFSVGIRNTDKWGIHLSEISGAHIHEYDCTSNKVNCPKDSVRCNLHFNKICLGPKNSGKKTLDAIVLDASTNSSDRNLVLKIDCEGCEWDVFDIADHKTLERFKTILVEFHWLGRKQEHEKYHRVMQKLLNHFYIVHTHGCNCIGKMKVSGTDKSMPDVVEVTFLRKDIGTMSACVASQYLSIDKPTCKGKEYTEADFVLE